MDHRGLNATLWNKQKRRKSTRTKNPITQTIPFQGKPFQGKTVAIDTTVTALPRKCLTNAYLENGTQKTIIGNTVGLINVYFDIYTHGEERVLGNVSQLYYQLVQ